MFKDVKGFSLVELAIGLMVVGLLLVPFVQYLTVERKRLETEETQTKYYQSIARAIGQFYLENEAYPCPAPLGRPITEAAAGLGACADIDALADDTCDFSAGAGYCKVVGTSPSPILIGAVP
ncbi:MAG: hypothetical protein EOM26_10815, partial [Alphaproteobacteria bacterium]|nr:hypothetical protein [Alphaproteobacteria bacterium]